MAKKILDAAHPKEMYLLALTEMCQRFAFWGVGNLLVLYLVQRQNFLDKDADNLFGIFTGVAFVLPVLGGYIADKLGYKMPVIWGSISTAIGCFLLATGVLPLVYLALVFIALGGAIFTPSVYAILGQIYRHKQSLRDGGFSIYYASVNIGVFLAMIFLGLFGQEKDWNIAFILAGAIQLVGLLPFHAVSKSIYLSDLKLQIDTRNTTIKKAKLHPKERARIYVIAILAFFSIIFWMSYNQGGSSMTLFALRFTDRQLLGFQMPPSWLLSAESIYLIVLAFPLALGYKYLAKRKKDPSPPMKCALSLFAIGLCFAIMTLGSLNLPMGATTGYLSPWYLLSAYGFMALGEMLICPIGLSLITHLSPHRYTAMLVGVWYFCIGVAFYLGGLLAGFMSEFKLSEFFNIFVFASFIAAIILLLIVKKLDKMRHADSM